MQMRSWGRARSRPRRWERQFWDHPVFGLCLASSVLLPLLCPPNSVALCISVACRSCGVIACKILEQFPTQQLNESPKQETEPHTLTSTCHDLLCLNPLQNRSHMQTAIHHASFSNEMIKVVAHRAVRYAWRE